MLPGEEHASWWFTAFFLSKLTRRRLIRSQDLNYELGPRTKCEEVPPCITVSSENHDLIHRFLWYGGWSLLILDINHILKRHQLVSTSEIPNDIMANTYWLWLCVERNLAAFPHISFPRECPSRCFSARNFISGFDLQHLVSRGSISHGMAWGWTNEKRQEISSHALRSLRRRGLASGVAGGAESIRLVCKARTTQLYAHLYCTVM